MKKGISQKVLNLKKRGNKMKKGPSLVQEKNPKLCLGVELAHTLFVL